MIAYALARNGKLVPGTLSESRAEAWEKSMHKTANATGLNWGTGPAAKRALARRGFRIVKVAVAPFPSHEDKRKSKK